MENWCSDSHTLPQTSTVLEVSTEIVFILLPVHNRRAITQRFVECLLQQTWPTYQLVLLDDGSSDGTAEMVRELMPSVIVIRGPGDWWWAGALQRGYEWLQTQPRRQDDVVLIINDDTEFAPDFLEIGVALLRASPRTFYCAQGFDLVTGSPEEAGRSVDWRRMTFEPARAPEEINCVSTRGLFMWAADFDKTSGFRPKLLPHYLSDYEFTIRAVRQGIRLRTDPSLTLRTRGDTTGCQGIGTGTVLETLTRYFSNRSVMNPQAWTAFVALSCPWPWKPLQLLRVWTTVGITVCGAILHRQQRARDLRSADKS